MQDGIYFDLPEEVYHALPRLSVSGMQKLLVSPATFWAGSWLNPKKAAKVAASLAASTSALAAAVLDVLTAMHPDMPEPDPEEAEESTKAQTLGKAYHTARLEPELLEVRFARQPAKSEMPKGSVFTGTEMGKELEKLKLPKSGSVAEQAARLIEGGFDRTKIWHAHLAEWEESRNGRTPIPAEFWEDIIADMELIKSTPEISEILTGGFAEVSILWTDASGLPMKARMDYLKPNGWSDFKSFSNPRRKHVEECIADAFAYNGYYLQAAGYLSAFDAIDNAELPVFGTPEQCALIEEIRANGDEPECWYVFQETGGIPNLLAKRVQFFTAPAHVVIQSEQFAKSPEHAEAVRAGQANRSQWFVRAQREIKKAKRLYRAYSEVYEPGEHWRMFNPIGELTDLSFRPFWLEQEVGE